MKNNLDEDSLKRLNLIIEKTKAYDDCIFPIGTRGEFGALYISDLKNVIKELETYKKIEEKIKQKSHYCLEIPPEHCKKYTTAKCGQCIIDWARKEVEKDD